MSWVRLLEKKDSKMEFMCKKFSGESERGAVVISPKGGVKWRGMAEEELKCDTVAKQISPDSAYSTPNI